MRGPIAFCFPGQGSLETGMGREIAEAVPEAMEVFRIASAASGLDLERLCFEAPLEELVETEVQQPALVATSLAVLAALRARGIEPDYVVGHSVGEFAALAAARAMEVDETIALVRERGLAMAEAARAQPGPIAPFMSTVTAKIEPVQRLSTLLVDQLTAPVKFTQAASALARDGVKTFVEVGPGNVLSGLLKRIDRSVKAIPVNSVAAVEQLVETLSAA